MTGDPWLNVHAVAEFVFCPRAGLLAHENQRDERDDELPAMDILPKFALAAIERALIELRSKIVSDVCIFMDLALSGPVILMLNQYWLLVFVAVGMVFYSHRLLNLISDAMVLLRRRHAAINSTCNEPDPDPDSATAVMEPVNSLTDA